MSKIEERLGSKLSNKEKLMFAGGALYSALLIIGGYKVGCELNYRRTAKQWINCFKEDPTLRTHIEEVAEKILNK